MLTIKKSEFKPENYKKLTLITNHRNGNQTYEYTCECDRCLGKGYVISHICNGKEVLMRPEGGVCFKCRGSKVMLQKLKVITDEEAEAKEAKLKKEAEERRNIFLKALAESKEKHLKQGYKLVDFKLANWFCGTNEDKEYNCGKYYIIERETEKAVLITFIDNLESMNSDSEWFPKKAIVR